jgi:hypothetical protein
VSGNTFESKDYATGRRTVTHDLEVTDRLPHEPTQIRAQAREHSPNTWTINVTHGPHETKDEQGSYYKHISSTQFAGPISKVKTSLRQSVNAEWKGMRNARR